MRQLNKEKTPIVFRVGVVLLCAMLITTSMMGGLYARYTTTVTGSATARVAKIDCAVNYEFSGYGDLGEIDGDGNLVYAVIEEFSVENTGEVTYTYDLKLKFSKDVALASYEVPVSVNGITLYAPKDVNSVTYVYHPSSDSTSGATATKTTSELTDGKYTEFEQGKVYYAYSTEGTFYTWTYAILTEEELSVSLQTLSAGQKYYYKIIYFIKPAPGVNLTQQQMTLFYNIICTQLD